MKFISKHLSGLFDYINSRTMFEKIDESVSSILETNAGRPTPQQKALFQDGMIRSCLLMS